MAQLVASVSGVVLGGVAKVKGSNLAIYIYPYAVSTIHILVCSLLLIHVIDRVVSSWC